MNLSPRPCKLFQRGFALIVTLILLMLLTVIALAFLTLSSISLRSSEVLLAHSQARANSRLALSLAIAQLQNHTGLDNRITAPADFVNPSSPETIKNGRWVGAWRSDEVDPKEFPPGRSDKFLSWLVTTTGTNSALEDVNVDLTSTQNSVIIAKLPASFDSPAANVRVPVIVNIEDNGRLGWWTEDESNKARADLPILTPSSIGEKLVARHGASRPQPEGLTELEDFEPTPTQAAGLVTPGQLPLTSSNWPAGACADFTTYSKSLMVNVKDGGFKQDLNTLFELDYKDLKDEYGPWYGKGAVKKPKNQTSDQMPYLYGWPEISIGARWGILYHYYRMYKNISLGSTPILDTPPTPIKYRVVLGSNPVIPDVQGLLGDPSGGYRCPRITQIAFVMYVTASPSADGNDIEFTIGYKNYVSLWNPFDTQIRFPSNFSFSAKPYPNMPINISTDSSGFPAIKKDNQNPMTLLGAGGGASQYDFKNAGGAALTMEPGENSIFTFKKTSMGAGAATGGFFEKGFYTGSEYYAKQNKLPFTIPNNPVNLTKSMDFILKGNAATTGASNYVQYMDLWEGVEAVNSNYEPRGTIVSLNTADYSQMFPEAKSTLTFNSMMGTTPATAPLIGSFVVRMRNTADPINSRTESSNFYLNSGLSRISSVNSGSSGDLMSERFEYLAQSRSANVTDVLGIDDDVTGACYLGLSNQRGPTHVTINSLPKVAPTSLAQFRHAGTGDGYASIPPNMGNERTSYSGYSDAGPFQPAPFADQAVGNSYASPLVAKDVSENKISVVSSSGAPKSYPGYDHRYKINQALWDKYFLSSLAPRNASFGMAKSMPDGWEDFIGGGELLNPRFSPWLGGQTSSELQALLFNGSALRPDAYKKIAAKLIYEGGFNVNSTSVPAWEAVLSSTRGQTLLSTAGGSSGISNPDAAYFSRSDFVSGDSVDERPNSEEAHFNGYRELNKGEIKRLAENIVKQVRLRGPFLNMAQFINRRLSTDDRLAMSGALQTAIDESDLNSDLSRSGRSPSPISGLNYPAAAKHGDTTAAGLPGWLMQGDILDPIAPSLVVRGDTFRIRAYGEARSASGKVLSRAWCEAVVQRVPEFVDPTNPADTILDSSLEALNVVNRTFGRRYEIVHFRWLSRPDA